MKLAGKFAWPSESVLLDGGLATELESRGQGDIAALARALPPNV